jgi:sialic acid synthase SpsE
MLNSKPIYVIAEMACSHEGNLEFAKQIIDGAGKANANAIQFQIWSLADMVVPHHPDYEKLTEIELSREQWTELDRYVRDNYPSMEIIACVYERSSVDFAESIDLDAYKIHSSDLSNPFLVKYVAASNKRIDLSVGASTLNEIQTAVEWIKEAGKSDIWLMYGYQNFPTPTDAIHLNYMMKIKELFELPIGYQDHSDGNSQAAFFLPAAAVGMGIDIIEKHITHDRSFKGIDHEAAINPNEFAEFVAMVREIETAMGVATPKPFSKQELKYRKYSKKSIVASRDLPTGTQLTDDRLLFMRASELGVPPDNAHKLVGKVTNKNVKAYQLITEEDVS